MLHARPVLPPSTRVLKPRHLLPFSTAVVLPSADFTTGTNTNFKLGLRIHQRTQEAITLGNTGAYGYATGQTPNSFNYDWSVAILSGFTDLQQAITQGYTFVAGLDQDSSQDVSFFCYDLFDASNKAGNFFDHCFGSLATTTCTAATTGNAGNYANLLASNVAAQQSWRYSFTQEIASPTTPGRYEVYIAVLNPSGTEILRVSASAYIGITSGTQPGPASNVFPCASGNE